MRLDCQDVADRVAPWLDEQLSPGESELFERHLDECASCRDRVGLIADQRFEPPRVREAEAPGFWDAMDRRLALELDRQQAEVVALRPASVPWWRREVRVTGAGLAAAMVLAFSLAALSAFQSTRAAQADAALASVQEELERERRLSASREPALPREPMVLVTHTPFRGSL